MKMTLIKRILLLLRKPDAEIRLRVWNSDSDDKAMFGVQASGSMKDQLVMFVQLLEDDNKLSRVLRDAVMINGLDSFKEKLENFRSMFDMDDVLKKQSKSKEKTIN